MGRRIHVALVARAGARAVAFAFACALAVASARAFVIACAYVFALGGVGGSPARGDDAPRPPSPAAIDTAIEKGALWLAAEQRADGTWGTGSRAVGHTVLAAFALVHAGVDPDDDDGAGRALGRAVRWLEQKGVGREGHREAPTYECALTLLLLRDLGRWDDPRLARLVRLLTASQAVNGQWSYDGGASDVGDNSNSQFAVLALGAAAGMDLEVSRDVLLRARTWWLSAVQADGGFGYSSGGSRASSSTGSMTAAGLAALAILDAVLGEAAPPPPDGLPAPAAVRKTATDLLAREFAVERNFGPAQGGVRERQRNAGRGWLHYYLWSVERALVLAGHEELGPHDWYVEGARYLLDTQKRDGSWRGEHPLYATCFALLFLTRAADPPRVFTPSERRRGVTTAPEGGDPGAVPVHPTPSGGAPLADLLGAGAPLADLRARCIADGHAGLLVLVRALDHRDRAVRQRANEALRSLLGDDRMDAADRHPLARGRLRTWIRRSGPHLVVVDGRFVLPGGAADGASD